MAQVFYVYLLIDPRNGSVFYVGKGTGKRAKVHFSPSSMKRRNMKNSTIKSIQTDGYSPIVEIAANGLTESEAFDMEKSLIAKFGRRDNGTGILTNMTDGGEGTSGFVHPMRSEETRKKISVAHTGMKYDPEVNKRKGRSGSGNSMYGRKKTEVHTSAMIAMHERAKKAGRPNFNAKLIRIFDADGNPVCDCHGNFKETCIARGFPHNALFESYRKGGEPIFLKKKNLKFPDFVGWRAEYVTSQSLAHAPS